MVQLPIVIPPQIEELPRDFRGYPIPAETEWEEGQPMLSKQDWRRFAILYTDQRCAICGCRFSKEDLSFRPAAYEDAQKIAKAGMCIRSDGPTHYACSLFSAMVCPFFATATARHTEEDGAPRGKLGAVMGFRNVAMEAGFNAKGVVRGVDFIYTKLEVTHWFDKPSELEDAYTAEIEKQSDLIDSSDRRFWRSDLEVTRDWPRTHRLIRQASGR